MERELRRMFEMKETEMTMPPALSPELRSRIGRQRMIMSALVAAAALALVLGGFAGARSLLNTQAIRPADPRPAGEGTFADVHGWIAYRSGSEIRAVDPADPGQTISLGSFQVKCPPGIYLNRCGGDPIGWSLDGTRLLVSIQIEGTGSSLYVLGDDGTTTRLSKHIHWGAFSPDGSQVVYSRGGGWPGPYLVDIDGGTPRSLADPCPRQACGEPAPEATAWSPDGSTIAWLDFGEGTIPGAGHENFLSFVNPDGTGLREGVATLPGTFGGNSLVWSPDGSRLVFWMADDDDRNAQIFVINADGTGLRQITDEGENLWPVWSPDGSRIAFVRDGALYTMAPDGSDVRKVEGVQPDGAIAWNPVR
jgi:hypothetical protein